MGEIETDTFFLPFATKHRDIFNYPRPRSPLAYTGLALLSMAVMDLAFNLRLPSLNHLFALACLVRNSNRGSPATWSEDTRRIMRFSVLYLRICCLVMIIHICVFYTVARGIATSPDELWGGGGGSSSSSAGVVETEFLALGRNSQMGLELYAAADPAADSIFSISDLKIKVILVYALMETFFCRWVCLLPFLFYLLPVSICSLVYNKQRQG